METTIIPISANVDLSLVSRRDAGEDGGPSFSIRVGTGNEKKEIARYDVFDKRPHYHYFVKGDPRQLGEEYNIDPLIVDDPLNWSLDHADEHLEDMLDHTGYPEATAELTEEGVEDAFLKAALFFVNPSN